MTSPRPRTAHRRAMVWTAVPGGVRGRERLTPVFDFLAVAAILVALVGAAVWAVVWGLRNGEGVVAALSGLVACAFVVGLWTYLAVPLRHAVVLRPATIELPVGPEPTRVVVRWDDVARVEVVAGERRPTLRVELRDGTRARYAEHEDPWQVGGAHAPQPDSVDVVDADAVARVIDHLLAHPDDRARLAERGGLGIVLAFSRPIHGDPPT